MSAPFFLSSSAGGERSARVDQPARAVWRSWVGGRTDHFLARGTQLCVLLWCLPEDLVQSSGDEDVHCSLLKRLWRRAGNGRSGARHRALCGRGQRHAGVCCTERAAQVPMHMRAFQQGEADSDTERRRGGTGMDPRAKKPTAFPHTTAVYKVRSSFSKGEQGPSAPGALPASVLLARVCDR